MVRTLDTVFYWAGDPPDDWDHDEEELRRWPPSDKDRRAIDAAYEAAVASAEGEEAARRAYERERAAWLQQNAPELAESAPVHQCLVVWPDDDDVFIEFEELDSAGAICGARRQAAGPHAFGSAVGVLGATSGREPDDPWVTAVCAALVRERSWTTTGRRSMIVVQRGQGTMLHVTASANRESIRHYGLDWQHMTDPGIAGSPEPELPGIFLCASRDDARFFVSMARSPTDMWAVNVEGLWLEGDPGANGGDNWMLLPEPVGPADIKLIERDLPPAPRGGGCGGGGVRALSRRRSGSSYADAELAERGDDPARPARWGQLMRPRRRGECRDALGRLRG